VKKNVKISIIVPVYNSAQYIGKCIESILYQSYKNYELLLINDGSTDDSLKIINKYSSTDDRIIVVNNTNKGILKTRIDGINRATGDYIMFVDSDDLLEPNALKVFINNNVMKYDVIRSNYKTLKNNNYRLIKEFNKKKEIEIELEKKDFFKDVLKTSKYNSVWRELIKKSIIEIDKFDLSVSMGDDFLLNMIVYSKSKNILVIKESTYIYRINDKSITNTRNSNKCINNLIDIEKVYDFLFKYIDLLQSDSIVNKLFFKRYLKEINHYLFIIIETIKEKEKVKKIIHDTFNNTLMAEARKRLKCFDLIEYKMFLPMFLLLKNSENKYYNLCLNIQRFYKKTSD